MSLTRKQLQESLALEQLLASKGQEFASIGASAGGGQTTTDWEAMGTHETREVQAQAGGHGGGEAYPGPRRIQKVDPPNLDSSTRRV